MRRTLLTRLHLAVLLIPQPTFLRTTASRTFSIMSTTNQSQETTPQNDATNANADQQPPKAPLALPAAPSDGTTTLDMSNGSTTVSLDHLGPMVVNVDGSMSRISNWDKMAEIEKKNTLRIIGKRNKSRLEALKKARGEGEEEAGEA
ncbi:hypothetical protein Q7P36_001489 [Cladosporium allicinum]